MAAFQNCFLLKKWPFQQKFAQSSPQSSPLPLIFPGGALTDFGFAEAGGVRGGVGLLRGGGVCADACEEAEQPAGLMTAIMRKHALWVSDGEVFEHGQRSCPPARLLQLVAPEA